MAKYNYGISNWNEVAANTDEERHELLVEKAKERIKEREFIDMVRDFYSWRAGQTFDAKDILVQQSTPQAPDYDEIERIQNMDDVDVLSLMFEDRMFRTNNTVGIGQDWSLMSKANDSENYIRKQQWGHIQEIYDLMPNRFLNFSGADTADPRSTLSWLGDALYSTIVDPVNLIPIPGAGKAASTAATRGLQKLLQNKLAKNITQETFEQAVKEIPVFKTIGKPALTEGAYEAGITGFQNYMEQGIRIDADLQKSFDKEQLGMSILLGFGLGSTLGTGMSYGAFRYKGRQFKNEVLKKHKEFIDNGINHDGKMLFKALGKSNLKYFDSSQVVEGRKVSYWHWTDKDNPVEEPVIDGTFGGGRNKTHQGNGGIGEFWLTSDPDMWAQNMDTSNRKPVEFEVDEDLIYDEANNPNLREDAERWAIQNKLWERVPDTAAAYKQVKWFEKFIPSDNLITKKGVIRKSWKSLTEQEYNNIKTYFENRTDSAGLLEDEARFFNDHFNNPKSPLYKADLATFNKEFRRIYKDILDLKYTGRATNKGKKSRWWRPELTEEQLATEAAEGRINPYKNTDHENIWVIYDYLTSMGYSGLRRNDPNLVKIINKQVKQDPDVFGPKARNELSARELVERAQQASLNRQKKEAAKRPVEFTEEEFSKAYEDLISQGDFSQYTPTRLRSMLDALQKMQDELPDDIKFREADEAYISFQGQESNFLAEDIDTLIAQISGYLTENRTSQFVWSRTHPDGDQLIWFDGMNGRPVKVAEGRGRSQNLARIIGNLDNEIDARSGTYGKENLLNLDRTKLGDRAKVLLEEVNREGVITGDVSLNVEKEEAISFIKKHDLDAGGKNPEDIVRFLEDFAGDKKKVITYMLVNRIQMTQTFYSMTQLARRLESNLPAAEERDILKELDTLYQVFSDQVRAHKNASKSTAQILVSQRITITDYTRRNVEEFLGHSRLSFEESLAKQGKIPVPLKDGSIADQKLFWNRFQELDDINYVIEDWGEMTAPNKWNLLAGYINANLLAGPTTQIINLAGTLVTAVTKPMEMYIRAADMYVRPKNYLASSVVDDLVVAGRRDQYMTNAQQVRKQALATAREATDTFVGLFTNIHHSMLAMAKSFHQNDALLDSRHMKLENLKRHNTLSEYANSIIDNFLDEGALGKFIGKVDNALSIGPFKPIRAAAKTGVFVQQLPLRLLTSVDEFIGVLNYRARTTAIVNRIIRERFPNLKGDDYKNKFNELFKQFFRESEQDVDVKIPFTDKVIGKYKNKAAINLSENALNQPYGRGKKPLMPSGTNIAENDPLIYSQETKFTQEIASINPLTGASEAGITGEIIKISKKYPILRPLFGLHFIATPTNLIRWFLQRSPSVKFPFLESGLGKYQFQMQHMLAKGPDGRYLSPERAAEAEARIRMGWLMWGGAMSLAASGYLNGGVESASYAEKRSQAIDQKRPPYSINLEINGKEGSIAFNRMDPFSFILGFAADMWHITETATSTVRDLDESWWSKMEEAAVMAMVMVQTNLSSKFWMKGALDMLTQIPLFSGGTKGDSGEFDPKTSRVLGRLTSKFIPLSGWWRHQNRTETEYMHEAYTFIDEIRKNLPVEQKLAPKRDAFGQKVVRPKGIWIMGGEWDASPFLWHEKTNPEVQKFLEEINFEYRGLQSGESQLGFTGQDYKTLKMKTGEREGQTAYDRLLELKGTIKLDLFGYKNVTLPELIDKLVKDPNSVVNKSGGALNYKENPILLQKKRSRLIKSKTINQQINSIIRVYEKQAEIQMQKEYGIFQQKTGIIDRELERIKRENQLY
tara:strand:- start:960 stop:6341 length:5382 start_codon:yes stop_codon:yes gene_type:complete